MGFAAGFRAGSELANDRARRELAAAQEERAKLEFQQRQAQWDREQKDRDSVAQWQSDFGNRLQGGIDSGSADNFLSGFDAPKPAPGQGLALPQGTAPAAASFMQNNLGVQNYVEQPQPQGLRVGQQQLDGETLTRLQNMAKFAKTPQDVDALEKAYNLARNSRIQGAVTNSILNASNEQLASIAQRYSDFGGTPGKMTVDKDGYTTIAMDGGDPIKMNRYQLAQFLGGMYKLKQGDSSGQGDIAAVSEQLAKAVGDMNANMRGAAQVNNAGANFRQAGVDRDLTRAETKRHNQAVEGNQAEQLKIQNKPKASDFIQMQNNGGDSVMLDVRKLKVGADGQVTLPAGLKPVKTRLDPQAYSATVKNLVDAGLSQADAQIKADAMFGQSAGPDVSSIAAALAKKNDEKGAQQTAAPNKGTGLSVPAQKPASASPGFGDLFTQAQQDVGALQQRHDAALRMLQAASTSGDRQAIAVYTTQLQQAAAQLQAAQERLNRYSN